MELILNNRLEVHNARSTPTFVTSTRKEIVDIILENSLTNAINRDWVGTGVLKKPSIKSTIPK